VGAGAEPARPQRFGERGRWVPCVGAMRLAGHEGFTDDGASTSPHGAASAGHGGWQGKNIKRAGGCGLGVCVLEDRRTAVSAAGSRTDTPALQDGGSGGEEAEGREGGSLARSALSRVQSAGRKAAGHEGSTDDGASTLAHGAASAGHGGWQARGVRARTVPNAVAITIQRARHGACPRGKAAVPTVAGQREVGVCDSVAGGKLASGTEHGSCRCSNNMPCCPKEVNYASTLRQDRVPLEVVFCLSGFVHRRDDIPACG